jgi:hypothetical protein
MSMDKATIAAKIAADTPLTDDEQTYAETRDLLPNQVTELATGTYPEPLVTTEPMPRKT